MARRKTRPQPNARRPALCRRWGAEEAPWSGTAAHPERTGAHNAWQSFHAAGCQLFAAPRNHGKMRRD